VRRRVDHGCPTRFNPDRVGDDRVSLLPRPQPMEGVARSATEVLGK
jgi:hypothetical protein